jgi:hypothetical protein
MKNVGIKEVAIKIIGIIINENIHLPEDTIPKLTMIGIIIRKTMKGGTAMIHIKKKIMIKDPLIDLNHIESLIEII